MPSGAQMTVWSLLVFIFALAGCGGADRDAVLSSPLALNVPIETLSIDLRRFIPKQLSHAGVPGLSIAVVRDGQVVWAEGFGVTNVITREPVRSDTAFEVASISKIVTAYTALRLVEQGKLALDVPLRSYLARPFLPASSRREAITLRRVLTHTSGLSNLLMGVYTDTKIWFPPGDHFSYSGHGFEYAAAAIEGVTGMAFEHYVETTVLHELRMDSSTYRLDGEIAARHAHPHLSAVLLVATFTVLWVPLLCGAGGTWWLARAVRRSRSRFTWRVLRALLAVSLAAAAVLFALLARVAGFSPANVVLLPIALCLGPLLLVLHLVRWLLHARAETNAGLRSAAVGMRVLALVGAVGLLVFILSRSAVPLPLRRTASPAAAGLHSTALDLARLMTELMEPSRIDPVLIHQMLQPQVRVSEHVSWGLGVGLNHSELGDSFWHWGSNPGYESLLIGYPVQKIGVVILTNGGPAGAGLAVARKVAHRAIGGQHPLYWTEVPGVFWPSRPVSDDARR